jgi:pimeloyl-ACP methyl ester carboxylesterase
MDMGIDEALLEAHASYRDQRLGISEEFIRIDAGSDRTLGVLALPLDDRKPLGWLICHSFGAEQVDLHMTDVALARSLAAAGYPTVRFHCQGYGDSADMKTPPGPSTHVRDTLDVLRQVPALAGADRVGLAGSRFGATVAALAADASGSTDLLMFQPIVNGRKYATELLRSRVIVEMLGDDPSAATTVEGLRARLVSEGLVNVKGWRMYGEVYEELCRVDLLAQLDRFSGRALVVQVSRGTSPQSSLSRLVARLKNLGAQADLEVLTHPSAPNFGYEHFRPVAKDLLGDILEGVNQRLSEMALSWVERDLEPWGEAP